MIKDYFVLSLNSLFKRRLRSWLTLLGIFIGIATVVALIGLGEGLREGITGQFNLLGNDVLTVQASGTGNGPPGTGVVKPLTTRSVDSINRVSGVKNAVGRLIGSTVARYGNDAGVYYISSVPENPQDIYDMLHLDLRQGRLLKKGESNKVMLGYNFGVDSFNKPVEVGKKITINGKDYEVVGILAKKGSFIIDDMIFMDEKQMRTEFNRGDQVDAIAVQVTNLNAMDKVKGDIEKVLRRERNVKLGEEDFTVETPAATLASLNSILGGVNIFVAALAGISIIVGGIGIANTMFTSVLERTGQIGVMKAIGAKNSDIFWLFLIESGLLGMVGGIVGVLIGIGLAVGGAAIASQALGSELFRTNISAMLIISALAGAFLVGAISGLIPAIRASRLTPVNALRYGK